MNTGSNQYESFLKDAGRKDTVAVHQYTVPFDPDNLKQVLALTWKIFVRHIPQCVVWAMCYLVVINAFGMSLNLRYVSFNGQDSGWIYYGVYVFVPPLLLLLFDWLHRMILGKGAVAFAQGSFHFVKIRPVKQYLLLCLGVAAAYICRDVGLERFAAAVGSFLFPRPLGNSFSMLELLDLFTLYTFEYMLARIPMLFLPALLTLQLFVDYLCIHAARTKADNNVNGFDTHGLMKRIFRVELRLMPLYLLAPLALHWAATHYAGTLMGGAAAPIAAAVTQALFLLLLIVYCVRSAMARTLLVTALPKAQRITAPSMDFTKTDIKYAREMEEEGEEPLNQEGDEEIAPPEGTPGV